MGCPRARCCTSLELDPAPWCLALPGLSVCSVLYVPELGSLQAQQLPCQPQLGAASRNQHHMCPAMQETAHACFPLPGEGSAQPQQEEPLLFCPLAPGSLQCPVLGLVLATNVRAALWA
ncbi:hypothetical protein KIL84_005890 [Mauremys mutica]|uniref:Uncharacterized protein n=1 Tax=Mauremys mutica TaxID=74926 RepID=A0A9D3XIT6_9SAUR|nr:hypothetical protein KIL84_005890 [Mauremys mutica]